MMVYGSEFKANSQAIFSKNGQFPVRFLILFIMK